jgi:phage shock protein A
MGQQQRELRRAAAEAFIESLDHLQQSLESSEEQPSASQDMDESGSEASPTASATFDLALLEEAIADIEQFIDQKRQA